MKSTQSTEIVIMLLSAECDSDNNVQHWSHTHDADMTPQSPAESPRFVSAHNFLSQSPTHLILTTDRTIQSLT